MRGALFVTLIFVAGCSDLFGSKDAHHPGTQLGTFHVKATSAQNSCGMGALGSQPAWEFDVKLARAQANLYWDNGQEIITGTVAADGESFAFDSGVEIDMRSPGDMRSPPCSVARSDDAKGKLDGTDADVKAFAGSLSYSFAPTSGSMCDDLVSGPTAIVAGLPCAIDYTIDAARTRAPD